MCVCVCVCVHLGFVCMCVFEKKPEKQNKKTSFQRKLLFIIEYFYHHYHHHHLYLVPLARILSPSLSLAILLFHPSPPAGLLDNIQCPYRAIVDKFLLVVKHMHILVKGSIGERRIWGPPYFNSACPVCLIWMVLEMGDIWPYSCCFVGWCFQDLFNIVRSILVQFPSSFCSICLVSIQLVHPYSSMDTIAVWKKIVHNLFSLLNHHQSDVSMWY